MILPRTRGWVSWFFSPPFVYKNSQSIGWCQPARSEAVSIFTHRLISSVTILTGSHIKIPLSVICVSFDTIKQAHKSSHHARERQYFFFKKENICRSWLLEICSNMSCISWKQSKHTLNLRVLKEVFSHCYSWLDLVTMVMPTWLPSSRYYPDKAEKFSVLSIWLAPISPVSQQSGETGVKVTCIFSFTMEGSGSYNLSLTGR